MILLQVILPLLKRLPQLPLLNLLQILVQSGVRTLNLSQWYIEMNSAAPTAFANPKGGSYNTDKIVTLSMNEDGSIYYTTDGSAPTISSTQIHNPNYYNNYNSIEILSSRSCR